MKTKVTVSQGQGEKCAGARLVLVDRELRLPLSGPQPLVELPWTVNESISTEDYKVYTASSDGLSVEKRTLNTLYFVQNGTSSEFNQAKPASGIDLGPGFELLLEVKVSVSIGLYLDIQVLEFDANLKRCGTAIIPTNKIGRYSPSAHVTRVMLVLRFMGAGKAVLHRIDVELWRGSEEEGVKSIETRDLGNKTGELRRPNPAKRTTPAVKPSRGLALKDASAAPQAHQSAPRPASVGTLSTVSEDTDVTFKAVPRLKEVFPGEQRSTAEHQPQPTNGEETAQPSLAKLCQVVLAQMGLAAGALENAKKSSELLPEASHQLEQIAYTWRRRALGWEEKYKSASQNSLTHQVLTRMATNVPISNGSEYYTKLPFRVGIIADVYMYNFYKDSFAQVVYLSPTNYADILAAAKLDAFIYTTCWSGIENNEWRGIKYRKAPAEALTAILDYCKVNNVKTIFQSIEDPSNFDYFLDIALRFDYIFTTDRDILSWYREKAGHGRVFFGEFGANPLFNNPIGCRFPAIDGAFFAGSYPTRYKERCEDMEVILDSLVGSGYTLVIADRNHGAQNDRTQFPERFRPYLIPKFDHATLQAVHKLFRFNLNFNSIKNSSTMCAMRVYELQAQGRALISSYSKSVYNNFPNVPIVVGRCSMASYLRSETLEDYRANMAAVREVMSNKTSFDAAARMMAHVDLLVSEVPARMVAVIADEITPDVRKRFNRQRYTHKILLPTGAVQTKANWEMAKREHEIAYFCYFSREDDYEEHYLSDLVNGFKYTASRYVTKAAHFRDGRFRDGPQHEFTNTMPGRAQTVFSAKVFEPSTFSKLKPHEAVELEGGYSIDPFELNYRRFLAAQRGDDRDSVLTVIVPVYNNGRFLLTKCMASLLRNERFPEIEVILVDDGSTDEATKDLCAFLCDAYLNVRAFYFDGRGSGSASRPRNKGIELASSPLIAFLDPDNEISPGGYDTLLRLYSALEASGPKVGFVSGYQLKVADTVSTTGRHTNSEIVVIDDLPAHFFGRGRFPVVSTQAAVIAKELVSRLRFVEGAAGQDTLFGWELLALAGRGAFTSEAFLIYYAQRGGSITNEISSTYFAKKVVLEKEQVRWLRALGLLDGYVESHFDTFMRDWYFKKLEQVDGAEREECRSMLAGIVRLYGLDPQKYGLETRGSRE